MTLTPAAMTELGRPECFDLLRSESIGRVGVSIGALPAVLPVTYGVLDESVVFRTAQGTRLHAASEAAVVAFEVDDIDRSTRSGWSVLIVGRAEVITDEFELARLRTLGVVPWVDGERDRWIRVAADEVTGRRIEPLAVLAAELAGDVGQRANGQVAATGMA